jgi:diguanylate cyclase (GGDEF)-like protein/PAS domain S-box-containing protein
MAKTDDNDFRIFAEYSVDMLCRVAAADLVVRYVSPSCFNMIGWTPEEMVGSNPDALIFAEDLPLIADAVVRLNTPDVVNAAATLRMLKKDGGLVWVENNARLIRDPITGEPDEYVLVMRDISERKMLEEKLAVLAMTDGLTGLANRRAFDEVLEREWKRTLREGSQISLLLLDLDYFKRFNDRYGHQVGDDCLRAVSACVKGMVSRPADVVARYGGEEIAVILPNTDTAGAVELAEKMRSAIEKLRITHEGNAEGGGWVTASFGAATALSRDGGTMAMPEGLLQAADTALYKAKKQGRNCVATSLLMAPKGLLVAV